MMVDLCTPPPTPGLVGSLLASTDCRATALVERGYAALSAPDTATAAMLTSLMVIAIAVFGYRLLLGHGFALHDATRLAIRLGIVLLLAGSWSSFHGVAYDTFARAPTRIADDLIGAIDMPAPLDGVQTAINRLEQGSVGWRTRAGIASPFVGGAPAAAMALNTSTVLLTMSTVGILIATRVVLSLLLAMTPAVAGLLLFDVTRGAVIGWLRAIVAAALTPLFVLVLSTIELAMLNPLIDAMLAPQARGTFELGDVMPVALVVVIFTLAILVALRAATMIARGIGTSRRLGSAIDEGGQERTASGEVRRAISGPEPIAAHPVARALESVARRDAAISARRQSLGLARSVATGSGPVVQSGRVIAGGPSPMPPSYLVPARPRQARASRAASRRDA